MPELPEVEIARKLLTNALQGSTICNILSNEDEIVFQNTTHTEFAEILKGKTVQSVGRKGKYFYFILDSPPYPVFHFGMTGGIAIKGEKSPYFFPDSTDWPPKYIKFILTAKSNTNETTTEIAFSDPRRLSRITFVPSDPLSHPPISKLGFDPLIQMPEYDVFVDLVKKRKMPVKSLLLDQEFSAGVGNWVADEILYHARVHPAHRTNMLTDTDIAHIYAQMSLIVKKAVDVDADVERFPKNWIFHVRWNKGKKGDHMVDDMKISFETVGGRTSAFVPLLQKLPEGSGPPPPKKRKNETEKSSQWKKKIPKKTRSKRKSKDDSETEEESKVMDEKSEFENSEDDFKEPVTKNKKSRRKSAPKSKR
ncbi:hypothetical protein HK098_006176 [Nowakowskiella sp. JEL0407]|nr:hypothetical protein HK098_006176 [Nowakowskiella sp. JEL0407]